MGYLMAIDAGTGSVRAVIFSTGGVQLAIGQREWFHREDKNYPGSMDFDAVSNWELVKLCIGQAIKDAGIKASEILAISCTAMREGFVLYDADMREIFACANVDARATAEAAELIAVREGFEKEIYMLSGQAFALGSLVRLLWLKNKKPMEYEKVRHITMLNDWIAFKLTGVLGSDPSNGCTTGMFGYASRTWNPEISRMCGLKDDIFPKVFEGGEKIGNISRQAADETGLSCSTIVAAGGGDVQIGAIGVGGVRDRDCCIFGGSFWQTEINTVNPKMDGKCRIRVNAHAVPGIWQYEAIAFFPGLIMRWYRDAFCQTEKLMEESTGVSAYELMDRAAAGIPAGSHGVFPVFSDVMNFINWKHAAPSFINLSLDPDRCNRYTLYRSLMENAALVTYGNLTAVESFSGIKAESAIFAGGAAKSRVWSQILADVCGIQIKTPVVKEAASLGAAMCAGVGAGVYKDMGEAVEGLVKTESLFEPDMEKHGAYKEIFEKWRKIYAAQLALADAGLTSHMWIAPGL